MENVAIRTISPNKAKTRIMHSMKKKRPIFIWGPPGIGKSDVVHQIGEYMDAHVFDIRLSLWEPTDIKGIPYYAANDNTMQWAPPVDLPDAKMAKKYKNIILFLDEMNSAAPAVQAAAYQLILNRRVGQYTLPDNVYIVAAGNREADKGVVYRMPAPLSNRFVHLELAVDFDDWFQWAVDNKINKDVVGYLQFSKKDLYDFDPKSPSRSFATPRSWSFVSELLEDDLDEETSSQDRPPVQIVNKFNRAEGYSGNLYDIKSATKGGVVYPSMDPSCFELKFPSIDIEGKCVGDTNSGGSAGGSY